jgi:hypothetical protein
MKAQMCATDGKCWKLDSHIPIWVYDTCST